MSTISNSKRASSGSIQGSITRGRVSAGPVNFQTHPPSITPPIVTNATSTMSTATPIVDTTQPWKHPAELEYLCQTAWSQDMMIRYLRKNAFTVPPRSSSSRHFVKIVSPDNTITYLPHRYRIPLLFVAKFQWESLRLVLTSSNPTTEWEEFKFDILHLSRLCSRLLKSARGAAATPPPTKNGKPVIRSDRVGGMDRTWRCPMFDRALTRFYRKWMICREWSVKGFWNDFGEEEYEGDVLQKDWGAWALKGYKGFLLTRAELENGITLEEFISGLHDVNGLWTWDSEKYSNSPDTGSGATVSALVPSTVASSATSSPAVECSSRQSFPTLQVKKEAVEACIPLPNVPLALPKSQPPPHRSSSSATPRNDSSSHQPAWRNVSGLKRTREDEVVASPQSTSKSRTERDRDHQPTPKKSKLSTSSTSGTSLVNPSVSIASKETQALSTTTIGNPRPQPISTILDVSRPAPPALSGTDPLPPPPKSVPPSNPRPQPPAPTPASIPAPLPTPLPTTSADHRPAPTPFEPVPQPVPTTESFIQSAAFKAAQAYSSDESDDESSSDDYVPSSDGEGGGTVQAKSQPGRWKDTASNKASAPLAAVKEPVVEEVEVRRDDGGGGPAPDERAGGGAAGDVMDESKGKDDANAMVIEPVDEEQAIPALPPVGPAIEQDPPSAPADDDALQEIYVTFGKKLDDATALIVDAVSGALKNQTELVEKSLASIAERPPTVVTLPPAPLPAGSVLFPPEMKVLDSLNKLLVGNEQLIKFADESQGPLKAKLDEILEGVASMSRQLEDIATMGSETRLKAIEATKEQAEAREVSTKFYSDLVKGQLRDLAVVVEDAKNETGRLAKGREDGNDDASASMKRTEGEVKRLTEIMEKMEKERAKEREVERALLEQRDSMASSLTVHEIGVQADDGPTVSERGIVRRNLDTDATTVDMPQVVPEPFVPASTQHLPRRVMRASRRSDHDSQVKMGSESTLLSLLLDEFTLIKDEMRASDRRRREEVAHLRELHSEEIRRLRAGLVEREERDTMVIQREREREMERRRELERERERIRDRHLRADEVASTRYADSEVVELRKRLVYLESMRQLPFPPPPSSSHSSTADRYIT